jgi:hypothetical protein
VSSEWFSRPADERYLSLSDLYAAVRGRTEHSRIFQTPASIGFHLPRTSRASGDRT